MSGSNLEQIEAIKEIVRQINNYTVDKIMFNEWKGYYFSLNLWTCGVSSIVSKPTNISDRVWSVLSEHRFYLGSDVVRTGKIKQQSHTSILNDILSTIIERIKDYVLAGAKKTRRNARSEYNSINHIVRSIYIARNNGRLREDHIELILRLYGYISDVKNRNTVLVALQRLATANNWGLYEKN
jgi:hypothetical protein